MEVKSTSQPPLEDGSEARTGNLWGASNLLSIARLLLTLPTCLLVYYGHRDLAVISFFVAAFTDYLDGWIARRFDQISDLGKILDPLADKVYVAGVVILLTTLGVVPLWFLLPILLRDLLILIGGLYIERKTGEVLPSNWTGKWAVGVLSITLLLFYLEVSGVALQIFIVITLTMLTLSLFLYLRRGYTLLQSQPAGNQ